MKPRPCSYQRPGDAQQALALLANLGDDGKVLAGGQSLLPLMNFRLAAPEVLVDIGRIDALRGISVSDDGWLRVGAATPQRWLEQHAGATDRWPLLGQAMPLIGHVTVRNRGTVGGSVAHADPAAELPAVLTALDAEFEVWQHGSASRRVPAERFFTGFLTTDLQPEDLLAAVHVPPVPPSTGQAWVELAQRHGDFALVGVAAWLRLDADGTIAESRLVYGGVASQPHDAVEAARSLRGRRPTDDAFVDAAHRAAADADPPADIHADATYRRRLMRALTIRALRAAATRAGQAGEGGGRG